MVESKVLSIMFTDIKGFTASSETRSRDAVMDLVQKHDQLLRPVIDHFAGRIIKTIGDAFLVVFDSPTNAVLCGLLMQYKLREYNMTAEKDDQIEIRISINSGEVQLTENDVFGDAVNIASRINSITEPNNVFFTEAVYLSMNKKEVPSSSVGEKKLKGIAEPVKVYSVIQDPGSDQYRRVLAQFKGVLVQSSFETKVKTAPGPATGGAATLGTEPGKSRLPLVAGIVVGIAAIAAILMFTVFASPPWAEKAREFAAANGFAQAWKILDEEFKKDPSNKTLAEVAGEVLKKEVPFLIKKDGHEATLSRLEEYREKRAYVPGIDEAIADTKQKLASAMADKAREFARADGYKQAWDILDKRFKEEPNDPSLRTVAKEIVDHEVKFLVKRDGHEKTVEALKVHEVKRPYIPDVKGVILQTRRDWADDLMVKGREKMKENKWEGRKLYDQALNILYAIHKEDEKHTEKFLQYLDALYKGGNARLDFLVKALGKVLELDPGKNKDQRVRTMVLEIYKEAKLSTSYKESLEVLYDLVATHYVEDVKAFAREWLNKESEMDRTKMMKRINAFRIMDKLAEVNDAERFEFHRLNLFEFEYWMKDYTTEAIEYFKAEFAGKSSDAHRYIGARKYNTMTLFKAGSNIVTSAMPILLDIFYESIRDWLVANLSMKDEVYVRYYCFHLILKKGELQPRQIHTYHLQQLDTWTYQGITQLYTYIDEALKYLEKAQITEEAWREEAVAILDAKLEIVGRVKENFKKLREYEQKNLMRHEERLKALKKKLTVDG